MTAWRVVCYAKQPVRCYCTAIVPQGVCRMVPVDSAAAATEAAPDAASGTTGVASAASVDSSRQASQAATAAAASSVRQRASSNLQGMRAVDL